MLKVLRLLVVLFFVTLFSFITSWSVLSRKDEEVEKPYQQTKEELPVWNYGEEEEEGQTPSFDYSKLYYHYREQQQQSPSPPNAATNTTVCFIWFGQLSSFQKRLIQKFSILHPGAQLILITDQHQQQQQPLRDEEEDSIPELTIERVLKSLRVYPRIPTKV